MLPLEAVEIGKLAKQLGLGPGHVCLNIGSSTRTFREVTQPYIQAEILAPLERDGCRVVNCDLKEDDGVDEVGNLLDEDFQKKLGRYNADLVLCSNLLEHLSDPAAFARACGAILKPGGYCLISVPRSFPYHPDPLDTMFRPAPQDIVALMPGYEVIAAQEFSAGTYWDEIGASPFPAKTLARQIARSLTPFYRPRQWWPQFHKMMWLLRPYRVSLVLLRKPGGSEPR